MITLNRWTVSTGILVAVGLIGISAASFFTPNRPHAVVHAQELQPKQGVVVPVKYVHPKKGALERLSTQPGTIQAFESVRLFAKVPGFLKTQHVDIGDRVKKGQILAVVDVPEIEAQIERNSATVDQVIAQVKQMKSRVVVAKANLDAAKATVVQAESAAKSAAAWVRYRSLQLHRMKDLYAARSIEERLVDESKERYEASIETEASAKEAITANKAKVVACEAKIEQAEADVIVAESEVRVARAELKKSTVQLGFAVVRAPFDGVVAHRSFNPGDFVRSANEGSGNEPLLTVQRTDKLRVIVMVPDRDVPFTDVGDPANIEIDAIPGKQWTAKISRIAHSEDAQTRLMQIELDLPNPDGCLCNGMYGRVTIVLDKSTEQLSVPSTCLVGKAQDGVGSVYVVRDHVAHLTQVRLGLDNGVRVAVVGGLTGNDQVILQPGSTLAEGTPVEPSDATAPTANAGH